MSHSFQMIPFICASTLPPEVEEFCAARDHPLHCDSGVVEVDLEEENPLASWLQNKGYQFSAKEKLRGWAILQ